MVERSAQGRDTETEFHSKEKAVGVLVERFRKFEAATPKAELLSLIEELTQMIGEMYEDAIIEAKQDWDIQVEELQTKAGEVIAAVESKMGLSGKQLQTLFAQSLVIERTQRQLSPKSVVKRVLIQKSSNSLRQVATQLAWPEMTEFVAKIVPVPSSHDSKALKSEVEGVPGDVKTAPDLALDLCDPKLFSFKGRKIDEVTKSFPLIMDAADAVTDAPGRRAEGLLVSGTKDVKKELTNFLDVIAKNIRTYSKFEDLRDSLSKLGYLVRRIIYLDNRIAAGASDKTKQLLKPRMSGVSDVAFADIFLLDGKYAKGLIDIDGLAAKLLGGQEISQAELNRLEKLRIQLYLELQCVFLCAEQTQSSLDANEKKIIEDVQKEIQKYLDWIQKIIGVAQSEPTPGEENKEVNKERRNEFMQAAADYLKHASGGYDGVVWILGFGQTSNNWTPRMKAARDRYTKALDILDEGKVSDAKQKRLVDAAIKIWDYTCKTNDGQAGGINYILDESGDNYMSAKNIREVVNDYKIEDLVWKVRGTSVRMLVRPPSPFLYGSGYVPNSELFRPAVYANIFAGVDPNEFAKPRSEEEQKKWSLELASKIEAGKDAYLRSHPEIPDKDTLEMISTFVWELNFATGMMDEAYRALTKKGTSTAHTTVKLPDQLKKGGEEMLYHAMDPLAHSLYLLLNTPDTNKRKVMDICFYSDRVIREAYERLGIHQVPKRVRDFRQELRMYIDVFTDANALFGSIDQIPEHPAGPDYPNISYFPDPLKSMLKHGLPSFIRWFTTDAAGYSWLSETVWEELPPLSVDQAVSKMVDFIKNGLGRAKLGNEGFPREAMVEMTRVYASRLALALNYKKIYPNTLEAKKERSKGVFRLATKVLDSEGYEAMEMVEEFRIKIIRKIDIAATTLKFISDNPNKDARRREEEEFRKDIMGIFGVPRQSIEVIKGSEPLQVEITDLGDIPDFMYRTYRHDQAFAYVRHHFKKYALGRKYENVEREWELFLESFEVEGIFSMVHPPFSMEEKIAEKVEKGKGKGH